MARYRLNIADKTFEVEILSAAGGLARVVVNGRPYDVKYQALEAAAAAAPAPAATPPLPRPAPAPPEPPRPATPAPPPPPAPEAPATAGVVVAAPMPGTILEILVQVGDAVKAGDVVAKLEAMKMENAIPSPAAGVVAEVRVAKGANVTKGEILLVISQG